MRRSAILLVTASILVSCQPDAMPDDTTTLPSPTISVSTTSTATSSTAAPTTTATTLSIPEVESAIYLFFEGYPVAPGPYLVAVARTGIEDLAGALSAVLEGMSEDEAMMGLSSTIPDGTTLLGVEVLEGVAHVDLSREFQSGGGSMSMMGRVAQIVYTATGFEGVDSVRFSIEGVALGVLGGEGLIIEEPQTRAAWVEMIPPISIEKPMWGSTVAEEIDIAGTAELESGMLSYVIVDADGLVIHEGEITTVPGRRSEFSAGIVVGEIPNPGRGSIIVWEWAPDGSQRHVLEYPLTLRETP